MEPLICALSLKLHRGSPEGAVRLCRLARRDTKRLMRVVTPGMRLKLHRGSPEGAVRLCRLARRDTKRLMRVATPGVRLRTCAGPCRSNPVRGPYLQWNMIESMLTTLLKTSDETKG